MRKPINRKIVGFGFLILGIGIMITIFANDWNESTIEVNPIGVVLIVSSIVVIVRGTRIRVPDLG